MSLELSNETYSSADHSAMHYRALSSAAVASLVLGVLSSAALLDWPMVCVPAIGMILGVYAVKTVRQRRDELSGAGVALAGLLLSIGFLVAGVGRLSYVYATEVPTGHVRMSYADLQPDPNGPSNRIPETARALNGKKVFIKGYPLPGSQQTGITQFVLCRDQGDCCFGGKPKITDRINVQLMGDLSMNYRLRLWKVGGTLHVIDQDEVDGTVDAYYYIEADHLQ